MWCPKAWIRRQEFVSGTGEPGRREVLEGEAGRRRSNKGEDKEKVDYIYARVCVVGVRGRLFGRAA